MDVSSVGYRDSWGRSTSEFVEMPIKGISTERDSVDMASHTWDSFSGNSCKTVIVSIVTALSNESAAYDLMNMLFRAGRKPGF